MNSAELKALSLLVSFLNVDTDDFCISDLTVSNNKMSFIYREKDEYLLDKLFTVFDINDLEFSLEKTSEKWDKKAVFDFSQTEIKLQLKEFNK